MEMELNSLELRKKKKMKLLCLRFPFKVNK